MDMMDLFKQEEIEAALEQAYKTRKAFYNEIRKLDNLIFIIEYYMKSGEAVNPDYIELPEEHEDE
jgi:hypothetical protein